jgi:tetratricopeptide (TPR) repeat protein
MNSVKEHLRAGLDSQLLDAPCFVEDTEDMFWLREADDYQSRVDCGNALAAQYRFKEAVEAYKNALKIRSDDWKLLNRLAGAELTLRRFDEAMARYHRCLELGVDKKVIAYPLGIGCYLQKDYETAATWFEHCLPCDDEMAIAVIYWHTLSCYRFNHVPTLLNAYHADMQVGHHTTYQLAVSVFCGELDLEVALKQVEHEADDLNYVIGLYGLCRYLESIGKKNESLMYLDQLLKRDKFWPCISYLAAWNDANTTG